MARPPRLTVAEREHARRVAVGELVYVAELAATSTRPAVLAFAALVLERAVRIGRRRCTAKAFVERDIQGFLAWWTELDSRKRALKTKARMNSKPRTSKGVRTRV